MDNEEQGGHTRGLLGSNGEDAEEVGTLARVHKIRSWD